MGDVEAGFKPGRRHRRARLQHQADAPGLHRAACLRRQRVARTARPSLGAARRAIAIVRAALRPAARHGRLARSASPRRRSAAASAARPLSISSRWRSRCRARRGRPVKMVMTREEVFRASGPTSGATRARQDRRQEGRHASSPPRPSCSYQAGAFAGSPVRARRACARSPATTSRTSRSVGYDVRDQPAEGGGLSRARRRRSRSSRSRA